ncbi:hypothetical protein Nmel_010388 [Mimus melanotis]
MTKAPFSVEWLSQSSQALRSPTENSPHRASSAGHRPGSDSRLGRSERSQDQPAGPRDESGGRSSRSRERLEATPAAGAGGRPSRAGQPVPEEGPECPGPEEPCGRGGRRLRTAFSAEQISTLESSFQRQQYLGAAERRQLAGRMRRSEVQIKTWFQNRRMKLKRQLQELRTEPFCSPALPYGPQGAVVPLPLTYVARPPPLARPGAASEGCPLAALPAPALDLESSFQRQQYLGAAERRHLAGRMRLSEVQDLNVGVTVALIESVALTAPDSGWLSADESSGYESESAGGERGGAAAAGGTRGRQRRARTAFTSEQVCRLEKTFQRQKYLGATERRKLAAALQLSEIQIKTWFQNRRMKLKRQIQDHQHSLVSPVPIHSYAAGTSPALFQDGLHYPFAAQHQRLLPFTPMPAVQFSFSFPRYDASQSTYHFMANELPYYHQHLLPHPSFHPVIQNKMDRQCHPLYAV